MDQDCRDSYKQKVEDRLGVSVTKVEKRSSAVLVHCEGRSYVAPWDALDIMTCACGHVADNREEYEIEYLVFSRRR